MSWRILINQRDVLAEVAVKPCIENEIDEHEERLCTRIAQALYDEGRMESGYYQLVLIDENGGEWDTRDLVA